MPLPAMLAGIPGMLGSAASSPFGQAFLQGSGNIAGKLFAGNLLSGDDNDELEYLQKLQQGGIPQMPTQNLGSSVFSQPPAIGRRFN